MSASDDQMRQQIQSTFSEHHKEIQRRSQINEQNIHDDTTFTKVPDVENHAFVNPSQKFIVFSLSHEDFAPRSENVKNPAVCIYGAFPTQEEATEYAVNMVGPTHPGISILLDETHKWIVAVKNPSNLSNASFVDEHRKLLLEKHRSMLHTNLKEFEENVAEKKTGDAKKVATKTEDEARVPDKKTKSHKISNQLDVRGQKLAVVSFVKDDADVPQFLFKIYAIFEKEEESNAYIRNVCGDKVQDFDIDVVSTCEWLFPQNMTYQNVNKEIFRSEELDRIMSSHRNQPKEVERFKETMKETKSNVEDGKE